MIPVALPWIETKKQLPPEPWGFYLVVMEGKWIEGFYTNQEDKEDDYKLANPVICVMHGLGVINFPEACPYWMPILSRPADFNHENPAWTSPKELATVRAWIEDVVKIEY